MTLKALKRLLCVGMCWLVVATSLLAPVHAADNGNDYDNDCYYTCVCEPRTTHPPVKDCDE